MGFAVFKNVNEKCTLSKIFLIDTEIISDTLLFDRSEQLQQSSLIVRNAVNLKLSDSVISNMRLYNAPVVLIEANRNIYVQSSSLNASEESSTLIPTTRINNVTFTNNIVIKTHIIMI